MLYLRAILVYFTSHYMCKRSMLDRSLLIDFCPVREYFTHIGTPPLPLNGFKCYAYAERLWPLNREGSLWCRACFDTGPRFTGLHPQDRSVLSPLMTSQGYYKITRIPTWCIWLWFNLTYFWVTKRGIGRWLKSETCIYVLRWLKEHIYILKTILLFSLGLKCRVFIG